MVAVVCAHRLPPVARGEGPDVGLGAGVNLGLADRPMDAKMSSSCLRSGFLGVGFCFFSPRLVILCGIESGAVGSRPPEKGGFGTGGGDVPSAPFILWDDTLGDRFGTN